MSSSGSVKLRYEKCLQVWGNAIERDNLPMRKAETTKINENGLRYKSKAGGSPFGGTAVGIGTMSCYKCGQHKPRAEGTFKRLLNQSMFVCGDCKTTKK